MLSARPLAVGHSGARSSWRRSWRIRRLATEDSAPHVLIARTVFGKGVSYMERQIKWHYWPMDDTEYAQALAEVGE